MIDWLKFSKKKKEKTFLVLDVGSETVKALIFKTDNGRIFILKSALEYFDEFESGFGDGIFLEKAILRKTILEVISRVLDKIDEKPRYLFLGLTPIIFKERIIRRDFVRKYPQEVIQKEEKAEIYREVFGASSREILKEGFLLRDLHFVVQKILEVEIDGYSAPTIENYRGRKVNFKILSAFLPLSYFKEIEDILQKIHFLKNRKIVPLSDSITSFVSFFASLTQEKSDEIFINIGGKITQIFLLRTGRLEKIDEFKIGGAIFSEFLSEKLGLRKQEARVLKERYAKGELSQESTERIKEILSFPCQTWFSAFKLKLGEMVESRLLPSRIGIFGGGSRLPEIKEVLEKGNWDNFSFSGNREVKSISLGNFKKIEDLTKKLNDPQFTSSFLIFHNEYEAKNL